MAPTNSSIVTPFPTIIPTALPTSQHTPAPTYTEPCCTRDFKNCLPMPASCSVSEEICVNRCGHWWLPNGVVTPGCTARFHNCTSDLECCSPGVCTDNLCVEGDDTPVPTPLETTVTSPTLFSCSKGSGISSWEALVAMEDTTNDISQDSYVLSVNVEDASNSVDTGSG
eukprot:CAMPEP_0172501616 /NCGR_PEP_ID=MMETSP1066-20121228/151570_1 /TAXON_ID=671091 /ORGANISM="Coscinodiscus wailesii, Strain CCMP2513" /LENGTH=168 /DNA_ID=CAMNT_0013276513 /DNA_START=173 /DNA_END=676 /DNA_ORIENTATION=+